MKRSLLPLFVTSAVMVFLYLPILVLVVNSFNRSRFGGSWEGFSFDWYVSLARQREIWEALANTLLVAVAATAVSTAVGTAGAFALHRYSTRLQKFHLALVYTPLVVPEVLMGISLLLLFVTLGVDLGLFTIFLAHVTFCISYVAMVVLARLQDFNFSLFEAAQDLGASGWTAATRVLLPLLGPGIMAGGLLAFTLSFDDFVVSFFVAGPGSTTLPIRVYSMIKHGSLPLINALSVVLLLVTFGALIVSERLTREDRR